MREEIVKRGIAVELCLTCNVLAGMLPEKEKAGFAEHHFGWWWTQSLKKKGISISLGTDDVGVFLSGLSEEYALAAEHFGLGEKDLIRLTGSAAEGAFDKRAIELVDGRLTAMGLAT
jgi:adenosine deaminase